MTRAGRFGLLAGLYLSQGLPYGFFVQALPVLLRQQGASLPDIGLTSLLALPWMLKFAWAPLVDRRPHGRLGRRRGVILPLQLAAVALLAALAWVSPERHMALLMAAVLACNLVAASQDVATDALAVDLLPREDRGVGNGIQVAAYRLGMILGGGAILVFLEDLGWTLSFLLMAGLLLLASVPIAAWREPPAPAAVRPTLDFAALGDWWRRSDTAAWMLLLFLFKLGEAAAGAMLRPMMVDAGLGLRDVGVLVGAIGSAAGLTGALLGGWGAHRLGRRGALLTFGALQAATVAAYAWLATHPSWAAFGVLSAVEHLIGGMATAALFTAMMDAARPERAATDYTLQACVVVAATGLGASVSGVFAEAWGYGPFFLACAALSAVGVGLVAVYRARDGGFVPTVVGRAG